MYNCCQQPIISPFTSGALKSIPRSLTNAFIFQTKPPHRELVGTLGFQLQQSNRSHSARHNISHYTHLSAIITTVIGPPDLARPPPGWYIITLISPFFLPNSHRKSWKSWKCRGPCPVQTPACNLSQSRSNWLWFWFPALNCFMQLHFPHTHTQTFTITETGSSSNHNPARRSRTGGIGYRPESTAAAAQSSVCWFVAPCTLRAGWKNLCEMWIY